MLKVFKTFYRLNVMCHTDICLPWMILRGIITCGGNKHEIQSSEKNELLMKYTEERQLKCQAPCDEQEHASKSEAEENKEQTRIV